MLLPIQWLPQGKVRYLDQTRLPHEEAWKETADYSSLAQAIRRLEIRGAPLIGIAAAYGLALAALSINERDPDRFHTQLQRAASELLQTRPTAVNLAWALNRCRAAIHGQTAPEEIRRTLIHEARRIHEEDIAHNRRLGQHGATLLPTAAHVITHCNAGSLATGGYGTALGVIRSAHQAGKLSHVYATETRPLLQGARLTAWELNTEGIPFTLIVDAAAGYLMRRGMVNAVIVGADRITANGDVANKIGTYSLAVLAHENAIPFYVAAPTSTIDLSLPTGSDIPIEERSPEEVTSVKGQALAPQGASALNPAFDVTPAHYVAAIITENGVATPPFQAALTQLCAEQVVTRG